MRKRVGIADHKCAEDGLEREILDTVCSTIVRIDSDTKEGLVEESGSLDGLIVDGSVPITEKVFTEIPTLEVVARAGIGIDNIDVSAATRHDVQVVNVPQASVNDVATHAVALLLTCVRKISLFNASVEAGMWDWEYGKPLYCLENKTLGLTGFGAIAKEVANLVDGFDIDVIAYDPSGSEMEFANHDIEKVSFEELLHCAHYHSIHAPLTEETRHMFDHAAFQKMKDNAILINTARGEIVDQNSLYRSIEQENLAGAGLDVLSTEPPEDSPLMDLEEVVITPHIGWYSEETIVQIRETAAREVRRVLQGERPTNPVN